MPTLVWIHAAWMLAAVAVGTWSGYLGLLRALQGRGGKIPLPGRFDYRVHKWAGIVYYVMLYLGILGGVLMVEFLFAGAAPEGLWAWHERLAVSIAVLYAPGAWLGLDLLRKPPGQARGRPIAHMVFNFTACTLVGVQILLALYAVSR